MATSDKSVTRLREDPVTAAFAMDPVPEDLGMETDPEPEVSEPNPVPPTLQEAFTTLCNAMEPLLEDQLPDQVRCQEIQGWYVNGNHLVSWQVAVQLLSQVLGAKLVP